MESQQAAEILELITDLYPSQFKLTDRKARFLIGRMSDMDYKRVLKKLEDYSIEHRFPPTLADIAAYAPEKNENLEKIKRWEAEAKQVTPELKEQFRQEFQKLLKDKKR